VLLLEEGRDTHPRVAREVKGMGGEKKGRRRMQLEVRSTLSLKLFSGIQGG